MALASPSPTPTGPEQQPGKQPDELTGLSKDVKEAVDKAMAAIKNGDSLQEVARGMENEIAFSYEEALNTLGDKTTEEFLDVKEAYEKAKELVNSLSEENSDIFKTTVAQIGELFESEWSNAEVLVEIRDPSL